MCAQHRGSHWSVATLHGKAKRRSLSRYLHRSFGCDFQERKKGRGAQRGEKNESTFTDPPSPTYTKNLHCSRLQMYQLIARLGSDQHLALSVKHSITDVLTKLLKPLLASHVADHCPSALGAQHRLDDCVLPLRALLRTLTPPTWYTMV